MKSLHRSRKLKWLSVCLMAASGCTPMKGFRFSDSWESEPSYHSSVGMQIEYPNVRSCLTPEVATAPPPLTIENPADLPVRELQLDDAIRLALTNSEVLRTLGGSLLTNTQFTGTKYDPAIVESNPLGGVEAALSAFDTQATSQLFWQVNDRPINVAINPILQQLRAYK